MSDFSDAIGKTIYMDRDQCEKFDVNYTAEGEDFVCSAEVILSSKAMGYDKEHVALLKPLGGATVIAKATGYGWFEITRVIPSLF
jgi:hypothetical protein